MCQDTPQTLVSRIAQDLWHLAIWVEGSGFRLRAGQPEIMAFTFAWPVKVANCLRCTDLLLARLLSCSPLSVSPAPLCLFHSSAKLTKSNQCGGRLREKPAGEEEKTQRGTGQRTPRNDGNYRHVPRSRLAWCLLGFQVLLHRAKVGTARGVSVRPRASELCDESLEPHG